MVSAVLVWRQLQRQEARLASYLVDKYSRSAPLKGAEQAARLAAVIAGTGLDPWNAHVAAVADAAICPILTLDAAKWRQHAERLDEPLHIIEIADPDEAPEDRAGGLRVRSPAAPVS